MWKCVFGEMDMCICLCQNTGAMNRSPTPGGVFRAYFVGIRCIINNPFAAKWHAVSSRRGWFIAPAYRNTPIKWRTETRVRWNGYTYTIMWKCVFGEMDMCIYLCQNTGAMNRPLRLSECFVVISWVNVGCLRSVSWLFRRWMLGVYGVFRGYFVGVRCIINNPFAAKWQAVSSCRGRFIVPAYRNTPIKWRTETRMRWNGYTYTIMWKCVFGEMDMCICLCQNMGAMNRSPTPGGVFRGYFVGVRCIINNPFAAKWQAVSSRRGRFIVPMYTCSPHIRKTLGAHLQSVWNTFT